MLTAALGLMAFAAASAQAVTLDLVHNPGSSGSAGFFLVNSGTVSPTALTHQAVSGVQIGSSKLEIPAKSSEIVCSKVKVEEGFVENEYENYIAHAMESGGHAHATLLFEECVVNSINASTGALTGSLTKCTEELNKNNTEGHITAKVLVLVRRHLLEDGKTTTFLIFEPLVASQADLEGVKALTKPFTTIKFGGTCALPATVNIFGGVAIKAPAADAVKPTIEVSTLNDPNQALLGAGLLFGANPAFIEAKAELELPANPGVPWGAM